MGFESMEDVKEFVELLIEKLDSIDEYLFANELKEWKNTYFTTSSEYLGELTIILKKILDQPINLDRKTKNLITKCIYVLKKALKFK